VSPYAKDELVIKIIPAVIPVIIIAKCKVFISYLYWTYIS